MNASVNNVLLISANIGSTFDFPDRMFPSWIDTVTVTIEQIKPIFFAVHCQEVGGKNYEASMQYVDKFIKLLLKNPKLTCYDKARIYLDEDFTVEEKFTALGSLYFIHESILNVEQWDFVANEYIPVEGRELFSANIEHVPHKFKEKFPLDFFPEQKWSRKGFIHTRWRISELVLDFVNIHLFHDICNLTPIIKDPLTYSKCRSRALEYTLKKVTKDYSETIPLFIFGDFNFRLSSQKLIKQFIEPETKMEKVYKKSQSKSDEIRKVVYRKITSLEENKDQSLSENSVNGLDKHDIILEIGRKKFDLPELSNLFVEKSEIFRVFDEEPTPFLRYLFEFSIFFPPSYPFCEEAGHPNDYMTTRCPSWCDRIFLNPSAKTLIEYNEKDSINYKMIGLDSCVGDHKPIYLSFHLNFPQSPNGNESAQNNNVENNTKDFSELLPNESEHLVNGTSPNKIPLVNHVTIDEVSSTQVNSNSSPRRMFNSVITNEFHRRKRHSVVDSINGLRASIDIDKYNDMWNIFDNGRFDKETELDIKFRLSHRPYNGISSSVGELLNTQNDSRNVQSLFVQAAKNITAEQTVISAFRQSINRKRKISDSSSENDPDDDLNRITSCDDVIVETCPISHIVTSDNANVTQFVPNKSNQNNIPKKMHTKNMCCTIS